MPVLPPGPSRLSALPFALTLARSRLQLLGDLTRRYGDVVYFNVPGGAFLVLNHPDYVRDVLVTRDRLFHKGLGLERARLLLGEGLLTSEDDVHARQRRLLLPAFHRERIAGYAVTMVEYARERSERRVSGERLDIAEEMAALALAIAGKTLFNVDVSAAASEIGGALSDALSAFNIALMPLGDKLVHLPIPPSRRFKRARARLDAIVYRMIAEHRAAAREGADVLSMLIAARDVEQDNRGMTDVQIRDEALTLLLAGHETTANALTWTWYLLSQYPHAETRLHDEIESVLEGRLPSVSDLPQLPYTRAVIAEAMRLFPPAYLIGRRAVADYDVPGTEYVVPTGTAVLMSEYLLHRDPRFWDRPEEFAPERWVETDGTPARHRYAYFPFGAGPRICIGEHFAWMEAMLVLATIAQRWRFRLVPGHPVEPQPIITLRARHGMQMVAERRRG